MNKKLFVAIFSLILVITIVFFDFQKDKSVLGSGVKTVIIDAGHGFPDGGAVADDGTVEADLNLAFALMLKEKLESSGINCLLTRCGPESVYSEGNTIHAKKISDIRNRIKLIESNQGALLFSIHMNTYSSDKVKGIQLFYKSNNGISEKISREIQDAVNDEFQTDNKKEVKKIPSNIYLFNNTKNESVLAECGFLTNSEDLSNLKNIDYRQKLTDIFAEVIIFNLLGER